MREETRGRSRATLACSLALMIVLASIALVAPARADSNPPLPVALGSRFVGNLSAPNLGAGASGILALTLTNPLPGTISLVVLSLDVYAFNAFPGNASSTLSGSSPPVLTTSTTSGPWANYSFPSVTSGARLPLSAGVVTSSTTPAGAYAVRTALSFKAPNGTEYRLASRGWFTEALWEHATELPNGTARLDNQSLSILNISGVLPETSIQVTSSALGYALYVILAVVFVLTGLGAYFYFARSRHSNSGAR